MTNYNDGFWHGWNGGECPVHPETVVEFLTVENGKTYKWLAKEIEWSCAGNPLVAFRVVKEHKVPREIWAVAWCQFDAGTMEHVGTSWEPCRKGTEGAVLFREVLE